MLNTYAFRWKLWFGNLFLSLRGPSGCSDTEGGLSHGAVVSCGNFRTVLLECGHLHCYIKLQARNISLNQWKVNEIIVCMLKQTRTYDEVGSKSHTCFSILYIEKGFKKLSIWNVWIQASLLSGI